MAADTEAGSWFTGVIFADPRREVGSLGRVFRTGDETWFAERILMKMARTGAI